MDVDAALIRRLEALAGLTCDDRERARLQRDLQGMIAYVRRLDDLVDLGESDRDAPATRDRLRDDEPEASLPVVDALAGAPAVEGDCFLSPPVRDEG